MKKKFDLWVHLHPGLKKLIMELKIAFIIILVSASNIFAVPSYSQVTRVSLHAENRSLEQVIDEIERQSEFYFIFNQKQIDVNRVINVQKENSLIDDVLADLFVGTNVNYAIINKKILLTTNPLGDRVKSLKLNSLLQQEKVTGRITDFQTGEPMPGVNVVVKGTTIGAMTDIDGKFSVSAPNQNSTLILSFIGYVTQEISLNGQTIIDVALKNVTTSLDEVVVVGYGTQKKISVTGAVVLTSDASVFFEKSDF